MTTAKDVLTMIKDNDVKYVDFRFTDPRGKWQHVTFDVSLMGEETFAEGQMFDGSSIAGWKAINESDIRERFNQIGIEAVGNSPEQAAQFLSDEVAKWAKVIRDGNITLQ